MSSATMPRAKGPGVTPGPLLDYLPGEPIYYAHRLPTELKQVKLVGISDAHYGNPMFSAKHFRRTIDMIHDTPDMYAFLNGDLLECSIIGSKGDVYSQTASPQEQRDWCISTLRPIAHKLLGATTGNHERRIYALTGIDVMRDVAQELRIPYRPEGLMLKVSFGNGNNRTDGKPYVYWAYFTHGYGGARTTGAKAVKLERAATYVSADVYFMSHDHVANAAPATSLAPDPRTHTEMLWGDTPFEVGRVKARSARLIKTNAYLKWGGYSEAGGYSPVDLEVPMAILAGEGKPRVRALI